jgi:hypothetical protein
MKVVCIDDGREKRKLPLTIGKVYEVVIEDSSGYKVFDDEYRWKFYWKGRFSVVEYREKILQELGI